MSGRRDLEAGRAFLRLALKDDMTTALKSSMAKVGNLTMTAATSFVALGGAAAAAVTGAAALFAKVGSDLKDMSERTGVSTNALSEFGHAASMTGASLEDVEAAIRKMQKTLTDAAEGSKSANEALDRLGLTAEQLKVLKPEDQFSLISERIAAISDPTTKAAAAMALFGKSGTKLLPMANDLKSLREEARKLGVVITPEQAEAADKLGDAWDRVKGALMGVTLQVGAAVAPALTNLADTAAEVLVKIKDFASESVVAFGDLLTAIVDLTVGGKDFDSQIGSLHVTARDLANIIAPLIDGWNQLVSTFEYGAAAIEAFKSSAYGLQSLFHRILPGETAKALADEFDFISKQAQLNAMRLQSLAEQNMSSDFGKKIDERLSKLEAERQKRQQEREKQKSNPFAGANTPPSSEFMKKLEGLEASMRGVAPAAPGGKGGVGFIGLAQLAAMAVRTLPSAKAKPGETASALPTLSGIGFSPTFSASAAQAAGFHGRFPGQSAVEKNTKETVNKLEKLIQKVEAVAAGLVFG